MTSELNILIITVNDINEMHEDIASHSVGNRGVGNLRLIGLVGLGPASRVFTFHLLDSLLTATTRMSICPHMTSIPTHSGGHD